MELKIEKEVYGIFKNQLTNVGFLVKMSKDFKKIGRTYAIF